MERLEYAIWGLTGDNGLKSEVRALRHELREERRRREIEAVSHAAAKEEETREKRRNRLTAVGIAVAGLSGFIAALLQVVNAG